MNLNVCGHRFQTRVKCLATSRQYTDTKASVASHALDIPPFLTTTRPRKPHPVDSFERTIARAHLNKGTILETLNKVAQSAKSGTSSKITWQPTQVFKIEKTDQKSDPPANDIYQQLTYDHQLVKSEWENGWGEDRLQPPSTISQNQKEQPRRKIRRSPPPHLPNPLSYSRRIEGLLEPSDRFILEDLKPISESSPIAKLEHGLERVLFNPGVHWLQDPRSRVYNFPPYLEDIPKVTDFAFERLTGFIKSSRDEDLWKLAKREKRTFAGSTSSLSGMLSHIYFLISGDKRVDTSKLSRAFAMEAKTFTLGQRMPASVVMNYNDGVYAIDSATDKAGESEKNILTWMGTLLEKYLTMTPEAFTSYMRREPPLPGEGTKPEGEAYRYAKSERFVMRSQLDCHDSRLPGTGVFDIKTRACLPIRMDLLNFEENSGYLIRTQTGLMESFEKEYFDLIRSAFLKYSFQVRIGNMDGVIVAYHNTARMFGFQYIPLQEMDEALFGSGPGVGDRVFEKCVGVLERIADEIVSCFPEQSVQCTFEKEMDKDVLNIWIEPTAWESTTEERPIRQLEVKVDNFLGQNPVRGSTAVAEIDTPWIVHWSISRLSGIDTNIRAGLNAAKARQFRAYNIPNGIESVEDMAKFWEELNFSGQAPAEGEKRSTYNTENFRLPGTLIQQLRAIARSGREETERLTIEEYGKPKVVLRQAELCLPEVAQAARDDSYSSTAPSPVSMGTTKDSVDATTIDK